ncbi:hypothetical protein [Altererythrobacter lutimaris]|uniref:Uncharacterized protein n=1 Tax=Altererythrobacter lutimaris TaxID=2743979 RepID=A0A850HDF0_9SPHN|nr:hypothetical protein [Altererythrobacter lutimaris]NVE95131.1 hypothetical protein [Altererythrobacter lutimaris]
MMRIVTAAFAYFAIVFGLGFVLGTLRVLWLAPMVGETIAGFIEMPIILGASWLAALWLVGKFAITRSREALAMGALAFALLMMAEVGLGVGLFEMTPREWLASVTQPPGLYGLIGQVVFGLMPWLVVLRGLARSR